jgi:hypothetical protein
MTTRPWKCFSLSSPCLDYRRQLSRIHPACIHTAVAMTDFIAWCAIVLAALLPILRRVYIEYFWARGRGTVIRIESSFPILKLRAAGFGCRRSNTTWPVNDTSSPSRIGNGSEAFSAEPTRNMRSATTLTSSTTRGSRGVSHLKAGRRGSLVRSSSPLSLSHFWLRAPSSDSAPHAASDVNRARPAPLARGAKSAMSH